MSFRVMCLYLCLINSGNLRNHTRIFFKDFIFLYHIAVIMILSVQNHEESLCQIWFLLPNHIQVPNRIRKRIAKRFGLPIDVFESWLTIIAVTRNACGDHARVWNKQNAIPPMMLNRPIGAWITLPTDSMRIYFDICIIKYFLDTISPNSDLLAKLRWLFVEFPEIDLRAMGFPNGWELEPLWR